MVDRLQSTAPGIPPSKKIRLETSDDNDTPGVPQPPVGSGVRSMSGDPTSSVPPLSGTTSHMIAPYPVGNSHPMSNLVMSQHDLIANQHRMGNGPQPNVVAYQQGGPQSNIGTLQQMGGAQTNMISSQGIGELPPNPIDPRCVPRMSLQSGTPVPQSQQQVPQDPLMSTCMDPTLTTSTGDFYMPTSQSQQTQNDFVSTSTSPQQEQAQQDGLLGPHQSQELMPTSQQLPMVQGGQGGPTLDPVKRKLIQQQLVLLLHADKCKRREREGQANGEYRQCTLPHTCRTMKNVLTHMTECSAGRACTYPHCASSRQIITHWKNCQRQDCPVCLPIRHASLTHTMANPNPGISYSTDNSQSTPGRPTVANNSLGPMSGIGLLREPSHLSYPVDIPTSTPTQAWQQEVTLDVRQHLVRKVIEAVYPVQDPVALQDRRVASLIQYAMKVEKAMFEAAESKQQYYEFLAAKIYRIRKELEERRMMKKTEMENTGSGMVSLVENNTMRESTRLYEEAMSKGYVETSVTKCLILGAAGVGKTHLKHLLLNESPPEIRVSTGLADNPVRSVSCTLTGVVKDEDDWFRVNNDELLQMIGATIKDDEVTMVPSLKDVVQELPKMPITEASGIVLNIDVTKETSQLSRTVELQNQMIQYINSSSGKNKLFGLKWIQFIDSGGQLQYHDILPLFVQNCSVIIFVLNLSETLENQPTIQYYGHNGKPVGKSYQSHLSHKKIIEHCLEAIHSQNISTESSRPLIITVGTHRDDADKCEEPIEMKDQQLETLNDTKCFRVLYKNAAKKKWIFPVNGRAPQDEDKLVAKTLRKNIVSVSSTPIKMPIAWFGLEVLLQNSSQDGILSLSECQLHAKKIFIEGEAFSAALNHLVNQNVFLYYPEVLPQTVFCNPQVVLAKVSELVEYLHKLRGSDGDEGADGDQDEEGEAYIARFKNWGLLCKELLGKFKKFYVVDLFTPDDLIKLLESRHAIAVMESGDYFMPALLPHLNLEKILQYLKQGTPLLLRSVNSCLPNGLFCCLVAHLTTKVNKSSRWRVSTKCKDEPLCLYRNCISFTRHGRHETVTLLDMFSYVAVHIHIDKANSSMQMCSEIRDCIYNCIYFACNMLGYNDFRFEDAFICPCACTPDPHVATVEKGDKYIWKCSIQTAKSGYLSADQAMWFAENTVSTGDLSFTFKNIVNALKNVVEWKTLGVHLDISATKLKEIDVNNRGQVADCKHAMIEFWLESDRSCSWKHLIDALISADQLVLAEEIRMTYCSLSQGQLNNDDYINILSSDSASGKWQVIDDELVFISDELNSMFNERM